MRKPTRTPFSVADQQAIDAYKWNFDAEAHELDLLHTRAGHAISLSAILIAAYISAHLGSFRPSIFNADTAKMFPAWVLKSLLSLPPALALLGMILACSFIPGISEAVKAINRYYQSQLEIEKELGSEHQFVRDVSLGRNTESITGDHAHLRSLRAYKFLPYFLIALWAVLGILSVMRIFN